MKFFLLLITALFLSFGGGNAINAQVIPSSTRIIKDTSPKKPTGRIVDKRKVDPMILNRAKLGKDIRLGGRVAFPGSRTTGSRTPGSTTTGSGTLGTPEPETPQTPEPETPEEKPNPDAFLEFEREGPSNIRQFEISDNIDADVDGVRKQVLSYKARIYGDLNTKSGYYYYIPEAYHLGWSSTTGEYDFDVTYGEATEEGPGPVTVTATLWPKLKDQEIGMLRDLLAKDIHDKNENQFGIKELMPYPMTQRLGVEFTNLAQFGVTDADISLQAPTSLDEPIKLTFTTRQINALMSMFFNNIGLYGNVYIINGTDEVPIPFTLKVDDPDTYGQMELHGSGWRTEWQNPTDYPLHLGHLHVLRKDRKGAYRVYSWLAGTEEIPAGATVNFGATSVPKWIDNDPRVKRIWLDYTIKECQSCNDEVKTRIFGSVNPDGVAKPEQLEFTILTPIAFTEASLIRIKIRSVQATAAGDEKAEMESVSFNEDGVILDGGTLYVRDGKVDFEYKMVVYLEDGTTYKSDWIRSNSKEVVIGSRQIRDNISEFND